MVLFKFEVAIYEELGLETTWVGHPLVDELVEKVDRETFFKESGLDPDRPLIALAPGSRGSEVRKLLPIMTAAARQRNDKYQFAVPLAPTIDEHVAQEAMMGEDFPILKGQMRPLMRHADAAIVASGTATLETGLLRTPMIVCYRL